MKEEMEEKIHVQYAGQVEDTKLLLHEEQLSVSKELVKIADVDVYREIYTENVSMVIPVIKEDLVIQKKVLDPDAAEESVVRTETVRIPLREERIDIGRRLVELEHAAVYRQKYVEEVAVGGVLQKEILHVETEGAAKVVDECAGSQEQK